MSASRKQHALLSAGFTMVAVAAVLLLGFWLVAAGMGVLASVLIGVASLSGGLVGIYLSVKAARGPRERALVILSAIVLCAAVGAAVAVFSLVYHHQPPSWVWLLYLVLLSVGARLLNRRQSAIRQEEQLRHDVARRGVP